MSKYYVMPQAGVGPGGEIVFRQLNGLGTWGVYVGNRNRMGMISPIAGGLWHAKSTSETPTEWLGTTDSMPGFGTRFAAGQFIIAQFGYWPDMPSERMADRDQWSDSLARLVKSGVMSA